VAKGETGAAMVKDAATATVSGASASAKRPSLFEPNYNDHILMRDGQLENWKRYLRDNPRRLMMRREYPDLFRRALCIIIDGIRYSAFGNMLLLRQPEKHQVLNGLSKSSLRTTDFTDYTDSKCVKSVESVALCPLLALSHLFPFQRLGGLGKLSYLCSLK
jgi:hypothetical protein